MVISGALCSQDFIFTPECVADKAIYVNRTGEVRLMELSKIQRKYIFISLQIIS